jgi:hypothetical protein
MSQICIGSLSGEHVSIEVIGYEFPESTDVDDGNWLISVISVRAGIWQGRIRALLRTEDFPEFSRQIKELYQNPIASAKFGTMEEWLELTFTSDRYGHINVEGSALDDPGIGNELRFHFQIDQSFLPAILESLEALGVAYPIRG